MMVRLAANDKAYGLLDGFQRSGRFPHAILLEGPAGSGKKTFARVIAQVALCTGETKPCGECMACGKVQRNVHPDVCYYTVPEGKKEFPVEVIREIRSQAYISPNEGVCKVYILDQAHAMNTSAQNALLKLIEEPPAFVRFILLCENRSRMLPTILSRVTCVELELPTVEQCQEILRERMPDKEPGLLRAAAAGASGNVGRAMTLLDTAKPSKAASDARILRDALISGERYTCVKVLAGYDKEREPLIQMLALLGEAFAQLSIAGYQANVEASVRDALRRVKPLQAVKASQAVSDAMELARRNVSIALLCAAMVENVRDALEAG